MFPAYSETELSKAAQTLDAIERGAISAPSPAIDSHKAREDRCLLARRRVADKAAVKLFRAESDRFDRLWSLIKLLRRPRDARDAYKQLSAEGITIPDGLVESWVHESRDIVMQDGRYPRDAAGDYAWRSLCQQAASRTEQEYRRCMAAAIKSVEDDAAALDRAISSVGARYGISHHVETPVHVEIGFVAGFLKSDAKQDWAERITSGTLGLRHELQRYCDEEL